VHFLGIVSPVHEIAFRSLGFVTFFQEDEGMPGFMDAVFGDHESGDELLISIDGDRSFEEMFSHLTGSDGVIVTGIPAGKS
jgi:hypothetical protein